MHFMGMQYVTHKSRITCINVQNFMHTPFIIVGATDEGEQLYPVFKNIILNISVSFYTPLIA